MDLSTWLTFFAAAWAISLSIGPGAVAAMGAGLSHGFARGYFITFGLVLGFLTQMLIVSAGLGALIVTSSLAFGIVKWAGVAYLVWLGITQWRAPVAPLGPAASAPMAPASRRQLVLRGWIINAVNPKGTVFMLAVVPQFLDPGHPLLPQYAVIGATLVFTDLVVMGGYTLMAARVLGALRAPHQVRWVQRLFGSLLIGMAALLATFRRSV
jgi:homoserine/homoserine lactone efflux protein